MDQKKYPEAFKYNAFAAQRGNAYGQGQLGYMYEAGLATRKSIDSAVKWYRLAAQQGDPYSISRLKELGK
ncbi:sel1 repeat family protein [Deinococcus psychrotolerans]|uniref:Sel1 repeat family protein n=1 Tax=Deinococcus psychrotolerans TaxID=2489213 RepID=A0A3G8YJY7_9DEIO|nr:sel1 repeat family protein [Deinococcus psychrotolerans]